MKIDKKSLPIFLTINKSKQVLPTLNNQQPISYKINDEFYDCQ